MAKAPRVVIVGAGFGAVACAKKLAGKAKVTIVAPSERFTFLPLVHELVSEESRPVNITRRVQEMAPRARFVQATAERADLENHTLVTSDGRQIAYDKLVVAIGAEPNYFGVAGAQEHALPFWSITDAIRANSALKRIIADHDPVRPVRVTVIGAGATGLEVAGEAAALCERYEVAYEVTLIELMDDIFPAFPKDFRKAAKDLIKRYHIRLLTKTAVKRVAPESVTVQTGEGKARDLVSDLTFWCAGIKGRVLAPLSMNVNWFLQSAEHPDVFVIGDAARFPREEKGPRVPQLAQTAEAEGHLAAHNALHPERMRKFVPKTKGVILSVGPGQAVAQLGTGPVMTGKLPWHVKKQLYKWRLRT